MSFSIAFKGPIFYIEDLFIRFRIALLCRFFEHRENLCTYIMGVIVRYFLLAGKIRGKATHEWKTLYHNRSLRLCIDTLYKHVFFVRENDSLSRKTIEWNLSIESNNVFLYLIFIIFFTKVFLSFCKIITLKRHFFRGIFIYVFWKRFSINKNIF